MQLKISGAISKFLVYLPTLCKFNLDAVVSSSGLFFELMLSMRELTTTDREIISQTILFKTHKLILEGNLHNTTWLVHGSVHAPVSTWQKLFNSNLKPGCTSQSQNVYKMSMGYSQILKFPFKNGIFLTIEYEMYLKIFTNLCCLVAFQNRPSTSP